MKVTVLGCGGSGGVPLADGTPGGNWGNCDPTEPRNRRRRVSVMVEGEGAGGGTLLIDCSPDLRAQLLDHPVARLDAVLLTHAHADHVHGIDDLRAYTYRQRAAIPTYMDTATHKTVTRRFDYVFASSHAESNLYPALLDDRVIVAGVPFDAAGFSVLPILQEHGHTHSLGYRIGDFAYSTDVARLDDTALHALTGLKLWVVDCLRMAPHPTHSHFERTIRWVEWVKPQHTILTHMNHSTDYQALAALCPAGVEPAYDGLSVRLSTDGPVSG